MGWYLARYKPRVRVSRPKSPPKPQVHEKRVWYSMKSRCKPVGGHPEYGGRGIRVCARWLESFDAFLADVGPWPGEGYSLERKNVNGPYEPGNVVWATRVQQARNTRASRRVTYQGLTLTVAEWSERTGIPYGSLRNRLGWGLPLEKVFRVGRKPQMRRTRGPQQNRGFGQSKTPEYRAWQGMLGRCLRPLHPAWKDYGGRGIKVCERWRTFAHFLADMGPRPSPRHSLERKRVHEGYEPQNCVWATRERQARNTRRSRKLTLGGLTLCLADWSEKLGVSYETLRGRLRRGWPIERVLVGVAV